MRSFRTRRRKARVRADSGDDRMYVASQWRLMWWKFKRHKVAIVAALILLGAYLVALSCEFLSPYGPNIRHADHVFAPPQRIHFFGGPGRSIRPFVYGLRVEIDRETLSRSYTENREEVFYLRLFAPGDRYRLWNVWEAERHLVGVEPGGTVFLLGTDRMGRDMLSRVLYGARISLSVGLMGVFLSLVLGLLLGGVSGYYGGLADLIIQRIIEFLRSFPAIPLWMALSAAFPPQWSPVRVYFLITVVLSLIGWTSLARVVRGKLLALRTEEFCTAAIVSGASDAAVIARHMIPSFLSHIIVAVTLQIPGMILAETALSFLGIGLRPPVISWGVLLREAQNVRTVALHPWLLLPGLAIVLIVLAFNFVGDGLRDAADPYK